MRGFARLPSKFNNGTILLIASYVSADFISQSVDISQSYNLRIEEAIVSLSRAAFGRGYQIAFVGDAHLALLIVSIAGEYVQPRITEGDQDSVTPCILRVSSTDAAEEQFLAEQLDLFQSIGQVQLEWLDNTFVSSEINSFAMSLQLRATVCIGGDDRIENSLSEARYIVDSSRFYTFSTTGGAAQSLQQLNAIAVDEQIVEVLNSLFEDKREFDPTLNPSVQSIPPYPLIAQRFVESLESSLD